MDNSVNDNPEFMLRLENARLREALERIQKFGHSHGHGRGYTCATWAKEALKG